MPIHSQWIQLLSTFIRRSDYEYIAEQPLDNFDKKNHMVIPFTITPQNISSKVTVNNEMQIW
jgi:hypothetical protein